MRGEDARNGAAARAGRGARAVGGRAGAGGGGAWGGRAERGGVGRPTPSVLALLPLLAAACGPSGADQLAASTSGAAIAPEAAITACKEGDPAAVDSCILAIVHALPIAQRTATVCAVVPEGDNRDECLFQAAEAALEAGNVDLAIQTCAGLDAFQRQCASHLWTYTYHAHPEQLDPMLEELRRKMPDIARSLDPGRRGMRGKLYREQFRTVDRLSLSLCAPPDPVCTEAVAGLLRRRWLNASQATPSVRDALCRASASGRLPDPDASLPAFRDLAWESAPELDAAVARAVEFLHHRSFN